MGYYVTLTGSDFTIPADRLDEAYVALCKLNESDEGKTGGSWKAVDGAPTRTEVWFAWMDSDYPDKLKTTQEILEALGFECDQCLDGSLNVYGYDSKTGQEDIFIAALAPFVPDGSYMEWSGEDGSMWRTLFEKGEAKHQEATIIWK
jgi:hypothetical protein